MILFGLGLVLVLVAAIGIVVALVVGLFGYAYLTRNKAVVKTQQIDPTF